MHSIKGDVGGCIVLQLETHTFSGDSSDAPLHVLPLAECDTSAKDPLAMME